MDESATRLSKIKSFKLVLLVVFVIGLFAIALILTKYEIETETFVYRWGYLEIWQSVICEAVWLLAYLTAKFLIGLYCIKTLERECNPELYYYLNVGLSPKIDERLKGVIELKTWTYGGSFEYAKKQAERWLREKTPYVFLVAVKCYAQSCYFTSDLDGLVRVSEVLKEKIKTIKFFNKKRAIMLENFIAVLIETLKGNYFKASEFAKELSLSLPKLTQKSKGINFYIRKDCFLLQKYLLGLAKKVKR